MPKNKNKQIPEIIKKLIFQRNNNSDVFDPYDFTKICRYGETVLIVRRVDYYPSRVKRDPVKEGWRILEEDINY